MIAQLRRDVVLRALRELAEERPEQARPDHDEHATGEQVGRRRERQPGPRLSPRGLTAASSATEGEAIGTRSSATDGTAEMMLSTPEDTDTATVIT